MTRPQLISAIASTTAPALDKAAAIQLVMECWVEPRYLFSWGELMSTCCSVTHTNSVLVFSKNRSQEAVRTRDLFIYCVYDVYKQKPTLIEVAKFLKRTNHTTILHARTKIAILVKNRDSVVMQDIKDMVDIMLGNNPKPYKQKPNKGNTKIVKNTSNGMVFDSIGEAAKFEGLTYHRFYKMRKLNPRRFPYQLMKLG